MKSKSDRAIELDRNEPKTRICNGCKTEWSDKHEKCPVCWYRHGRSHPTRRKEK